MKVGGGWGGGGGGGLVVMNTNVPERKVCQTVHLELSQSPSLWSGPLGLSNYHVSAGLHTGHGNRI